MAGTLPTSTTGYLGSAVGNLLGTSGSNTSNAAAQTFAAGQYQPYSINNPLGQTSFSNGTANTSLSPLQSNIQGLFGNQISNNLSGSQASYDPNTSFLPSQYQSIFGNMQGNVSSMFNSLQAAQAPQTAQYLQSNLDNEQAKGTLASTAGAYQTAGAQTAANTQMNNNMAQAQTYALNNANSQFGAAANTQQQGEQQAEFAPQLATQQNTADYSNLLNAGSLMNQQTSLGGSLGALQSQANTSALQNNFTAAQQQDQAQSGLLNGLLTGNGTSGGLLNALLGTSGSSTTSSGGALGSLGGSLGNYLNGYTQSAVGSGANQLNNLTSAGSYIGGQGATNADGSLNSNYINAGGQASSEDEYLQQILGDNFSGAGGQATNLQSALALNDQEMSQIGVSPSYASTNTSSSGISSAGSLYSILQGAQSGTATGQASAALQAAALANKNGLLGNSATNTSLLNGAGSALGLATGIQQGGVSGYGNAAVSALKGGSAVAGLAGNSALAGTLGSAAGYLAAPLSLYNFAKTYQSGATGSDALSGAEAGASVGSIVPGIGTAIGAVIGAAVGALSSAFGGGKTDPETQTNQSIDSSAGGTGALAGQSPSTSFQYLAGVMDAKNDTAGHSEPIEQVFGRMGEGNLLNGIAGQVNSALQSGAITKSTSAANVYSQVISPWLSNQGAAIDPNAKDEKGNNEGQNIIASIQNLIGSYMSGQLNTNTAIGVTGQKDSSLPALYNG